MKENHLEVSVDKYKIIMDAQGGLSALRHGEPWRDLCGDNLVYTLAAEVSELREKLRALSMKPIPCRHCGNSQIGECKMTFDLFWVEGFIVDKIFGVGLFTLKRYPEGEPKHRSLLSVYWNNGVWIVDVLYFRVAGFYQNQSSLLYLLIVFG